MSALFTPKKIGPTEIKNSFVHSATYECMADCNGEVTDKLIKRYKRLAKGGVGLIIPGYCFVSPNGRAMNFQTGIHNDTTIPGLKKLAHAVHADGSKIAFQLVHSGRQTAKDTIGQTQLAPSKGSMDSIYMARPKEMGEGDIQEAITAFGSAASRAEKAGADGIQVHAAHGYLVKLNTQDFTPKAGITPELAKKYAAWLAELSIDGLEVSCGTLSYSMFNMVRGDVPTKELVANFSWLRKKIGKIMLAKMEGKFDLDEGYNLEAAKLIKPVIGDIPLMVVGGMRKVDHMQEVIENGFADFISMSRPFIRDPNIVNKFKEGKAGAVSCVSCNKCFAGVGNHLPVACYNKGFPK
jgi:2,4-dienoyl-CoA reductase-like NADH-dependent reductase (Old Yellow Enzyme family)